MRGRYVEFVICDFTNLFELKFSQYFGDWLNKVNNFVLIVRQTILS